MKRASWLLLGCAGLGLGIAVGGGACSGDQQGNSGTAGGGAGSSGPGSGGGLGIDAGNGDSGLDPDAACVAQSAGATLEKRPVDVIFVIDNSGSMTDEIVAVQNNINDNFAAIIEAEGVDYRVIMLAEHGEAAGDQSVCISMPLSGTSCNPVPAMPANNPPIFYHYSTTISSHDSLCLLLDTFAGGVADDFGLAPTGWSEWLRPDSLKVIVEITDDGVTCSTSTLATDVSLDDNDNETDGLTAGDAFDAALTTLSPMHFGSTAQRNYIFYSIVGVGENDPPTAPWAPADPMVLAECSTAEAPGTGYQALSRTTGGLRFPLCQFQSYNVVFQAIAEGVIAGATVQCEFPVPDAPPGETIDLSTVVVQYTPGGGADAQVFSQVPDAGSCGPASFYIDAQTTIRLCPEACAVVQADAGARLDVLYGCTVTAN